MIKSDSIPQRKWSIRFLPGRDFFVAICGYGLYSVVLAILLLWLMFPADHVRKWLASQLQALPPGAEVTVKGLKLTLPWRLDITDFAIRSPQSDSNLLQIPAIHIYPNWKRLLGPKELPLSFSAALLSGTANGSCSFAFHDNVLKLQANLRHIKMQELSGLQQILDRHLTGMLDLSLHSSGTFFNPVTKALEGQFTLSDGSVTMKQPVLGLADLPIGKAEGRFRKQGEALLLEKIEVQSKMFTGSLSGKILPAGSLWESALELQGTLQPRPEMLAGIEDESAKQLVRAGMKDGVLSFTVTGTVQNPAILFEGMPAIGSSHSYSVPNIRKRRGK